MDIALASIIMCVNSVKILRQESNVKIACQVIMEIQPTEDSVQVIFFFLSPQCIFSTEKKIEKSKPLVEIYFIKEFFQLYLNIFGR